MCLQMCPAGSHVLPDLFASLLSLGNVCRKLPRRDALHEHLVELLVRPALGLWVVEVEVHAADDRLRGEDECGLGAEVWPSGRGPTMTIREAATHWLCLG